MTLFCTWELCKMINVCGQKCLFQLSKLSVHIFQKHQNERHSGHWNVHDQMGKRSPRWWTCISSAFAFTHLHHLMIISSSVWKIFHWNIQDGVGKDCDNGLCSLWHPCLHSLLYEYGQGCLISYIQSKSSWSSLDDYHMQQLHQHHRHHICHHQLQQQYHHHRRHYHHHGQ